MSFEVLGLHLSSPVLFSLQNVGTGFYIHDEIENSCEAIVVLKCVEVRTCNFTALAEILRWFCYYYPVS